MRSITLRVLLALILLLALCAQALMALAAEPLETDYHVVSGKVQNGSGKGIDMQFIYSDSMLEGSALGMNPELAKISSILASAAYDPSNAKITDILGSDGMGFDLRCQMHYGESMPIEDCHHVAYSIWSKEIEGDIVYCVPVRGSPENGEWYSDFTLKSETDSGYEGKHYGFYKAAKEIERDLFNLFAKDGFPYKRHKLWIMGHSRGAGVANIVAGEMTVNLSAQNVFGYNFACPYVSKSVKHTNNIFNFNCAGDAVPTLPLKSWGYDRYGVDIIKNPMEVSGFNARFSSVQKHDFDAAGNNHPYVGLLRTLMPTESDYESAVPMLMILGYCAGGSKDSNLAEVYTFLYDQHLLALTDQSVWDMVRQIFKEVSSITTVSLLHSSFSKIEERYNGWKEFLYNAWHLFDGMPQEEFDEYCEKNRKKIDEIIEGLGMTLSSPNECLIAYNASRTVIAFLDGQINALKTLVNFGGQIGNAIFDGHDPITYVFWMSSAYNGYMGHIDAVGTAVINTETFGPRCFEGAARLTRATMTEDVKTVVEKAFGDDTGLNEVVVSNSVQTMGNGCLPSSLTKLTVPFVGSSREANGTSDALLYYLFGQSDFGGVFPHEEGSYYYNDGQYSFYRKCDSLRELTVTDTRQIPMYAFTEMSHLEKVTLPDGLEKIGESAFKDCSGLTGTLTLPKGLNYIGKSAFEDCSGLTGTLTIPENIKTLPAEAFNSCSGLTEVILPKGLTTIEDGAFRFCDGLTVMEIPNSVQTMGNNCLPTSLTKLTVPFVGSSREANGTSDALLYYLFGQSDFSGSFAREEGRYYYNDGQYSIYRKCDSLRELTVTDTRQIPMYAFTGMSHLEKVTLPDGLEKIGAKAFEYCAGISKIRLPINVVSIQNSAFYECSGLKTIYYLSAEARKFALKIDEDGNLPLLNANWCWDVSGFMSLPTALTVVNDSAFYGTAARQFVLHENVTQVGDNAFADSPRLRVLIVEGRDTRFKNNALSDSPGAVVLCRKGSAVAQWCAERHIPCVETEK